MTPVKREQLAEQLIAFNNADGMNETQRSLDIADSILDKQPSQPEVSQ